MNCITIYLQLHFVLENEFGYCIQRNYGGEYYDVAYDDEGDYYDVGVMF